MAAMTVGGRSRAQANRTRGPDSIVKNTTSTFVAQMTTASLTAVLTVFLVRALGARQYGLFALTIGMGSIAVAFADVGITNSTTRFVAEHRGRDAELRALIADALKMKVILTGFVCALLAGLASVIAGAYGNPDLVWPLRGMAAATFGQSSYLLLLGVSTALGRAAVNVRLVAAESLLEFSSSIALVLAGAGATGAAFGRALGYVLGAIIAAVVVLRLRGQGRAGLWRLPERANVRRIGRYAGSVFAIDASYTLSGSLSVLFLGAYAGSAASGIFQAPAKLITLIQYVGLSTANGVAPRLARGSGQEPNVQALNGALRGLIGFQCLMMAPAVVWAGPITHVLLGKGYARSADVLAALAPYIFFSGLAPLVTSSVNYLGEAGRRVPIAFATLGLVAAGGFILIPGHGVVGAAIATDVAFGFYTLAHIWLCRRLLKLRLKMLFWSLGCGLTAAAAMGIVLASIGTQHLTILQWLEGAVGGLATYVTMLVFTREIRGAHLALAKAKLSPLWAARRGDPGPDAALDPAGLPHPALRTSGGIVDAVQAPVVESPEVLAPAASAAPDPVALPSAMPTAGQDEQPERHPVSAPAPAGRPPAWVQMRPPGPGPGPGRRVTSPGDIGHRAPTPAAQPPSSLSERWSSDSAGAGSVSASAAGARHAPGPRAATSLRRPSEAGRDIIHQIAWKPDGDAGVFELRPTAGAHTTDVPAGERSGTVSWGWRLEPGPVPEAREAHEALVQRLLVSGWRDAGSGDAWFAHRFLPPESPLPGAVGQGET